MEVYHTSNVRVEKPDTVHSRKELDFGPGFYFTSIRTQAEKYAFKFLRRGQSALLNIYDFSENWEKWNVKFFPTYDEEWLDFVMGCRSGIIIGNYDMIIGGIANDKVFDTLDLYTDKLITKEDALQRLKYLKANIQYCIRTEAMLKECLTFKVAEKL
ncbi:MAG: DUF3990 domain-containing protein [Candidatus Cryptobacteroides sp.]